MNRAALFLLPTCALLLAGCAENRYCASPQEYETAPSVPLIQSTTTMKVQPAPNAYLIPAAPPNPVTFGEKVNDSKKAGKTMWSCLDQPVPLPPPGRQPAASNAPVP